MSKPESNSYCGENSIITKRYKPASKIKTRSGVSLLEIIVIMVIIMTWITVMLPVMGKARREARSIQNMENQRQIVIALTCFSTDNNGRYPDSVATIGSAPNWNWQEPTMLTSACRRTPNSNRSLSSYLRSYIEDATVMFCANAPEKYKYLQQAWDAAENWDNPETPHPKDPVIGTYCFYWNYTGFLEGQQEPFKGPHGPSGHLGESSLLISDYFGYGHWRNPNAYGSCEKFDDASVASGTLVSSNFWSFYPIDEKAGLDTIELKLHAAYIDGHVECYYPSQTIPMKVSMTPDGSIPYPDSPGPGIFYIPQKALY